MSLTIIKAGLLDTVQDLGRNGYQHLGINPGGAMDRLSAALANALLGNDLQAPVLELHFPAAHILFTQPTVICLAGADFFACINNQHLPLCQPVAVSKNSRLTFRQKQSGARCYLALASQLQVKPWLNSYSTNLKAGAGGYKGRQLNKEDEILFAAMDFNTKENPLRLPWRYRYTAGEANKIKVLPGPEWNWLTAKSQTDFLHNRFCISLSSDRMGYRLQGETLQQQIAEQLVSSPVTFGTVQLLPNGQLIVLMADHQTTGGYPRVATVAGTDVSRLAQLNAGEEVNFVMTTLAAAEKELVTRQHLLQQLQNTCKLKLQNWLHAH